MKKCIILLSLYVLSLTVWAYDFYRYSPKPRQINGENYPRHHYLLYRGTTDAQMDLSKALAAMFGDQSAYLESFFFTTIKKALMKESFPPAVPLDSYLSSQVKKAIAQKGAALDRWEATDLAKKLVDGHFLYHVGKDANWAIDRYINYDSGNWIDWPKKVVFSSLVSPAAGTYGDRIVVIEEQSLRSIDLNYWNKEHNGKWFDHTRDAGEFSAPGYIPAGDIVGYEIRHGKQKWWQRIDYIFYKEQFQGKTIILVFSGKKDDGWHSNCALRTHDKRYVHCQFKSRDSFAEGPRAASRQALSFMGVVVRHSLKLGILLKRLTKTTSESLPTWVQKDIRRAGAVYIPLSDF